MTTELDTITDLRRQLAEVTAERDQLRTYFHSLKSGLQGMSNEIDDLEDKRRRAVLTALRWRKRAHKLARLLRATDEHGWMIDHRHNCPCVQRLMAVCNCGLHDWFYERDDALPIPQRLENGE